jgi:hypothetical protein
MNFLALQPTTVATPAPSAAPVAKQPKRDFDPLDLTFFFSPPDRSSGRNLREQRSAAAARVSRSLLTVDRAELHTLTATHLLEAFQAELGTSVVLGVNLLMQSVRIHQLADDSTVLTESISGNVVFSSPTTAIRENTLNRLVQHSFEGNALELYRLRLQIADDDALRRIDTVRLGDGRDVEGETPDEVAKPSNDRISIDGLIDGSIDWSPLMITIAASVAAATMAMCGLACILCWSTANRRSRRNAKQQEQLQTMRTRPTEEEDDGADTDRQHQQKHQQKARQQKQAQKSRQQQQQQPHHSRPQQPQNSRPQQPKQQQLSRQQRPPVIEDEENSVDTSVYSYIQDDTSLCMSAAPSILYSIHEDSHSISMYNDSRSQSVLASSPAAGGGTRFSVMESITRHFREDQSIMEGSAESGSEKSGGVPKNNRSVNSSRSNISTVMASPPRILGPASDSDSRSNSYVYDDEMSLISDLGGGLATLSTPAKTSFEALWRDTDEEVKSPPTTMAAPQEQKTVRKNNTSRAVQPYSSPNPVNASLLDQIPQKTSGTSPSEKRDINGKSSRKPVSQVNTSRPAALVSPLGVNSPDPEYLNVGDVNIRMETKASDLSTATKTDEDNKTNESLIENAAPDVTDQSGESDISTNQDLKPVSPSGLKDSPIVGASVRTKRASTREWAQSSDPSNKNRSVESGRGRAQLNASAISTGSLGASPAKMSLEEVWLAAGVDKKAGDDGGLKNGEVVEKAPISMESEVAEDTVDETNDSRYISESEINAAALEYLPEDASVIQGDEERVVKDVDSDVPDDTATVASMDGTLMTMEKNDYNWTENSGVNTASVCSLDGTLMTMDKSVNIWRQGPGNNPAEGTPSSHQNTSNNSGIKVGTLIHSFDNVWNNEAQRSGSPSSTGNGTKTPGNQDDDQTEISEDDADESSTRNPYLKSSPQMLRGQTNNTSFADSEATARLNHLLADGGCSEQGSLTEESRLISFCLRDKSYEDMPGSEGRPAFESLLDNTLMEQDESFPNDKTVLPSSSNEYDDEKKDDEATVFNDTDTVCTDASMARFVNKYKGPSSTMASF